MSDELLRRATVALRRTTAPHAAGAEEMLAKVSRPHATALASSRSRRAWVVALAATFVGVGAWASAAGKLPMVSRMLFESPPEAPAARSVPAVAQRTAAKPPLPTLAPLPLPEPSSAAEPAPAPVETLRERRRALARAASEHRVAAPSATELDAALSPTDVDSLYRDAHRAHFSGADHGRAIAAWDRYLSAAGSRGRMLVEARYNRAIALARVGRAREAISALRPFADGEYGDYRRQEARTLIASLESSSR